MSWHIEVVGTKEDVTAAIDEAMASQTGMPPVVGSYLKDAVAAVNPKENPGYLVHVKSTGHRPMEGAGSSEECLVRCVRSKPWKHGQ